MERHACAPDGFLSSIASFVSFVYSYFPAHACSRRGRSNQVEIGRTSSNRQQEEEQPAVSEPAESDAKSQQWYRLYQPQQSIFLDVSEEDGGLFSASSRTWLKEGAGRGGADADGDKASPRSSRASSSTSTLPPSPAAAVTNAAGGGARPQSELPPLVPKTRSRCTTGTCRRQQQSSSSRAAYFA